MVLVIAIKRRAKLGTHKSYCMNVSSCRDELNFVSSRSHMTSLRISFMFAYYVSNGTMVHISEDFYIGTLKTVDMKEITCLSK